MFSITLRATSVQLRRSSKNLKIDVATTVHHSFVHFTRFSEGFWRVSGSNVCDSVRDLHSICLQSVNPFRIRDRLKTHDLRLSPSLRNPSIILNISFRPCTASTLFPPMLILTFSFAWAINSFLNSKCLICMQTNTPQSLLFCCCGESAKSTNSRFLPNN